MTRRLAGDRGSVTAEFAVAMFGLVVIMLAALTGVSAMMTKAACVDAARDAVLAASRGESGVDAGRRVAPDGATVEVGSDGDLVRATVRAKVRPLGRYLPALSVTATAATAREPGSVP